MRQSSCARVLACAAIPLLACSAPARYLVVSEDPATRYASAPEQRLVFLARADADANAAIVGLREQTSIERYRRERGAGGGPVEEVLFQLLTARYEAAEQTLRAHAAAIPAYLQPLLAADLASERREKEPTASELLQLYQAAYDAQDNPMARAIIELRIRQLRYER